MTFQICKEGIDCFIAGVRTIDSHFGGNMVHSILYCYSFKLMPERHVTNSGFCCLMVRLFLFVLIDVFMHCLLKIIFSASVHLPQSIHQK